MRGSPDQAMILSKAMYYYSRTSHCTINFGIGTRKRALFFVETCSNEFCLFQISSSDGTTAVDGGMLVSFGKALLMVSCAE